MRLKVGIASPGRRCKDLVIKIILLGDEWRVGLERFMQVDFGITNLRDFLYSQKKSHKFQRDLKTLGRLRTWEGTLNF